MARVVALDDRRVRIRQWRVIGAAALIVAIAAGVRWWWADRGYHVVRAHVVEGVTTAVNDDRTAIGIRRPGDRDGAGYSLLSLTQWRGVDGAWHSTDPAEVGGGKPDCLPAERAGARVRAGVVEVPEFGGGPAEDVLVWIECLSAPPSP